MNATERHAVMNHECEQELGFPQVIAPGIQRSSAPAHDNVQRSATYNCHLSCR